MKAAELQFNLIDSYLKLLNNLSAENKLELISRLSDSLKGLKKENPRSFRKLFGAFESIQSAEQIITELKINRSFSRNTEQL